MTKRIDLPDPTERYLAGESAKDIAQSFGVTAKVVERCLAERGIETGFSALYWRRRKDLTLSKSDVATLYVSGQSEKALADRLGMSRSVVRKILKEFGITPRGRSDSLFLRMSQTSKEGRLALTKAAHAAVRGIPQSQECRENIALTKESRCANASPSETDLAERLRERGVTVVQQKAVGRYNVDIALTESSVAVEIFGGHWHASGHHAAIHTERFDYFLDSNWIPVIVWNTKEFPITASAVNYLVALHQARRRGEPVGREEHVIRGDGYGGPISKGYPECVPVVPCYEGTPKIGRDNLAAG